MLSIIDRIRDSCRADRGRAAERVRFVPFVTSRKGRPMDYDKLLPYEYGFGVSKDDPMSIDLTEPLELMRTLVAHGVAAINITCGSPYYSPHMQRPAIFPPTDGRCLRIRCRRGRQIHAVSECKRCCLTCRSKYGLLVFRSTAERRAGGSARGVDFVGLGRMVFPIRTARRHARGKDLAAKNLPYFQRLHHSPAQRPDLRLLPARSALQGSAGARQAGRHQTAVAIVRRRAIEEQMND
jgi:hypothetical protein